MRQLCSYLVVGGTAALVEWLSFGISNEMLGIHYMIATVIAFIIATFVNWILGRVMTFRDSCKDRGIWKDLLSVYSVSVFGLGFNMILMFIFVQKILLYAMPAKILATGLVFIWNFMARKILIYKV